MNRSGNGETFTVADPLPLPIGTYRLPAVEASRRQLVNLFAAAAPPERFRGQPVHLIRAPGIKAWGDTGANSETRGGVMMAGTLYVVAGSKLYSVFANGVTVNIAGATISGNGPVRMQTNGTSFVITPGDGTVYTSNGANLLQSTDPVVIAGQGLADVAFLDAYYVFRRRGTSKLINSGLNALTFDPLDITDIDGAPDNTVGLLINNREIILPGETTTERWYNAANATGSPFSRSPQGFYEIGCAAGSSLANQDNAPAMLANDKTFRRLGSVWDRISQDGIDSELQRMMTVSDCYAIPYSQEGHLFVAWTFPNAGRTFVMDFNTGEWHERESRVATVSLGRWRVSFSIQAYGMQIVGDSISGKLGILDPDTHEEWGEPQTVRWYYQPVYSQGLAASHRRLELGIATGRGTVSGQGMNPLLTLFVSDDGGNTYRARPMKELGKLGEYRKRIQFWNLGESRNRGYACEVSDPVRLFVVDTLLDADGARL